MDQGPMQRVRRGTLPDASGAEAAPGPSKRPGSEVKSHRTRVPGRAVRLRWATRPETPVPRTRNSGLLPDGRPCHRGHVRQGRHPSLAGRAFRPSRPPDAARRPPRARRSGRDPTPATNGPEPQSELPSRLTLPPPSEGTPNRKRSIAPGRTGAPRRSRSGYRPLVSVSVTGRAAETTPPKGASDSEEPRAPTPSRGNPRREPAASPDAAAPKNVPWPGEGPGPGMATVLREETRPPGPGGAPRRLHRPQAGRPTNRPPGSAKGDRLAPVRPSTRRGVVRRPVSRPGDEAPAEAGFPSRILVSGRCSPSPQACLPSVRKPDPALTRTGIDGDAIGYSLNKKITKAQLFLCINVFDSHKCLTNDPHTYPQLGGVARILAVESGG